MPSDIPQRKAFKFFREHLQSQVIFTKKEFGEATGWSSESLRTYWSKQFKPLVVEVGKKQYRVSEAFRPFLAWRKFQRHVTQNRKIAGDYKKTSSETVMMYEFFMPLTNETTLKTTLDALFFSDNVTPKLRAIGAAQLTKQLPKETGEDDEAYLTRVTKWIGDHFGGYSIFHVSGRFKAGTNLLSREQAAVRENSGSRYLVDETTAVTRFFFPCSDAAEADKVRYFFDALFVQGIIQLINAEDEIWMIESGLQDKVHIWKAGDDDDDGSEEYAKETADEGEEES